MKSSTARENFDGWLLENQERRNSLKPKTREYDILTSQLHPKNFVPCFYCRDKGKWACLLKNCQFWICDKISCSKKHFDEHTLARLGDLDMATIHWPKKNPLEVGK